MKNKLIILFTSLTAFLIMLTGCALPGYNDQAASWTASLVSSDLERQTSVEQWLDWIEKLSGAEPVIVNGQTTTIDTRFNYAMFSDQENAQAFEYVQEQVTAMVGAAQVEVDPYEYRDAERAYTWKNLIVTLPGTKRPEEVVVLAAHLDSIVVRRGNPMERAPGANDNATGVATLLEAVRVFKDYRFARTIKIIFFTGEELGLVGSRAYVQDHDTQHIKAVINLDMFGFDSDNDRCFEIHAGSQPLSTALGLQISQAIDQYDLNLTYDFLTDTATDRSDHAAFWEQGVPAVLLVENFFDDGLPNGCQGMDGNPVYHKPEDTVDRINSAYAFDIAHLSLHSTADLAEPLGFRSVERLLRSIVAAFWEQF